MPPLRNPRRCRLAFTAASLLVAGGAGANEGRIAATVLDRDGNPVPQAVVYAEALGIEAPAGDLPRPTAVMDQKDRRFVPHILVVRTGTEIHFPNSDSVSHHVYSFSPAKAFELALYKQGTVYPPLMFDTAGVVTLGCNIHDDMVGYVLVVDTPHFATTDSHGEASLDGLPAGRYRVHVWTPRLRSTDLPAPVELDVTADAAAVLTSSITTKLFPAHDTDDSSLPWARY
jgi:plastocyanin